MKPPLKSIVASTLILLSATAFLASCCHKTENLPPAPNYADSTQWYIRQRNAPVDVFYIISTETGDYTSASGLPCHYADTYNDTLRAAMLGEMAGVDALLCDGLNYFSPFYRQCTLESFVTDSLAQARFANAMKDVSRSFDYYIKNLNHRRPFVLMGFSQGAMAVVELLKQMADSTYSRMVAAYVIGWHIAESDLAATRHIRQATDSTDLGVTICYNSVRNNSCAIPLISDGNRIAVNPVNWRTDATPATLISPISPDTLTITLDTISKLLIVNGYTPTDYMLPLVGRQGNYHRLEISLYRDVLHHNIALRTSTFVKTSKETTPQQ